MRLTPMSASAASNMEESKFTAFAVRLQDNLVEARCGVEKAAPSLYGGVKVDRCRDKVCICVAQRFRHNGDEQALRYRLHSIMADTHCLLIIAGADCRDRKLHVHQITAEV